MNVEIVNVDPQKSNAAKVIYEYGKTQYLDGLVNGFIYSGLVFIFLASLKNLIR
jgi:hypothetical protein